MVNEEKLREEISLAMIEKKDHKVLNRHRNFYKSDYLSVELLKSFFSGSIAFILLALFYLLSGAEDLLSTISSIDYQALAIQFVTIYLSFMAIYMMVTYLIYTIRFAKENKQVKKYKTHLKRLEKIYQKDEKEQVK